ncbi:hypothetical protein ENSA7_70620 [Enhygromyxa salina]|uniref:Uncharacterized protein n=1 Tax=Enhygromyxa salina TaxID=215803 RepID=A0A2S9XTP2_9BACT|nr:hypothetical protein ENSA7_70620 [Enhygromyxa salina]
MQHASDDTGDRGDPRGTRALKQGAQGARTVSPTASSNYESGVVGGDSPSATATATHRAANATRQRRAQSQLDGFGPRVGTGNRARRASSRWRLTSSSGSSENSSGLRAWSSGTPTHPTASTSSRPRRTPQARGCAGFARARVAFEAAQGSSPSIRQLAISGSRAQHQSRPSFLAARMPQTAPKRDPRRYRSDRWERTTRLSGRRYAPSHTPLLDR